MQTHIPAPTEQAKQQQVKTAQQPVQLVGEEQAMFEDSRAETEAQVRLQVLATNSPQATQLKAMQAMMNNSSVVQQKQGRVRPTFQMKEGVESVRYLDNKVIQAKTDIAHTTSEMTYDNFAPETVGISMTASLDPRDKVQGSATDSPNTPMYSALYKSHKIVRGHLLNHDLGGFGLPENLFPITSGANSEHSIQVEANVKDKLAEATRRQKKYADEEKGIRVNYAVNVENPKQIAANAFLCQWQLKDPSSRDGEVHRVRIPSMNGENMAYHGGGTGSKTAGWAHGSRKGDKLRDRDDYKQIQTNRAFDDKGVPHASAVAKLAAPSQVFEAEPHKFVSMMLDMEEIGLRVDKGSEMKWFHVMAQTDGGLEEIEDKMSAWDDAMDAEMRKVGD